MKKKLGGVYYLAPEVIKGSYTEKCDIWSCGVILYIILSGYPPFSGNDDEKIEKNILSGEFNFKGNEWTHVSEEAKDFIKKLLEFDENKRISAEEALQDPWFQSQRKKKLSFSEGNQKKIHKVLPAIEIKNIILEFIQNGQKIKEDNGKLREIFESYDLDHDYHLPQENISKSFEKFKADSHEEIAWIDSLLDSLEEDSYNYNEILMITYKKRIAMNKENLERALYSIDKNEENMVNIGSLLEEFKKDPKDLDDWPKILVALQKIKKMDDILISELKESIFSVIDN